MLPNRHGKAYVALQPHELQCTFVYSAPGSLTLTLFDPTSGGELVAATCNKAHLAFVCQKLQKPPPPPPVIPS